MSEEKQTEEHKHRTEAGSLTLSTKPFSEYSPEEFRQYVGDLFVAPPLKKPKPLASFKWEVGKKGYKFKTSRKPKWIMNSEFVLFCSETGLSESAANAALSAKGVTRVKDADAGRALTKAAKGAKS